MASNIVSLIDEHYILILLWLCSFLIISAIIISRLLLNLVPNFGETDLELRNGHTNRVFRSLSNLMRNCILSVLSVGPLPTHIAFIMDGNRRYARKHNLNEGDGHRAGFLTLVSILKYCYELNVKYITVYAFSIDNFKRRPEEVRFLMDLMQEKIEGLLKEEGMIMEYGVRVHFVGNLNMLSESAQSSIDRVMKASAHNTKAVLVVCVAYTSTDEVVHSIQEYFQETTRISLGTPEERYPEIQVCDVNQNMYMAVAPDPDLLIRSSGEARLSNFVLWQTANCLLYSPSALWPELGIWHLVWSILNYQRHHSYLEKKRKQP